MRAAFRELNSKITTIGSKMEATDLKMESIFNSRATAPPHRGLPTPSTSIVGTDVLTDLEAKLETFVSTTGPCVAAEEVKFPVTEKDLVKLFTKKLVPIFEKRTLVNSEDFRWLVVKDRHPKHYLKPDLFWCHPALYSVIEKPNGYSDRTFGVISDTRLYEDVFVADCKLKIDDRAIGELANHMRTIITHTKTCCKGMLFDVEKSLLLEFDGNGIPTRGLYVWHILVC